LHIILIQWIKEFGPERPTEEKIGQAVAYVVAQIGLGSSSCDGEWRPFNYETIVRIATHELGHILGFEHYEYDYKFKGRIRICSSEKAEYYIRVESEEPLNF